MNTQIYRYLVFGLLLTQLGLVPSANVFADDLKPPQKVIADVSENLQKKLQDKTFNQNFAHVTQYVNSVIGPHTDFDKIAPLVLGKHWGVATPTEQERFKIEFQNLLVRAYARAFVEYNDWTIQYLPLDMANNSTKVVVKTKVLQRNIQPVEVYYRMFQNNGEWKVYDIVIDGVSLVTNYRSTFSEDIQRKGSLTAVIDSLAKRNAEALISKAR
jgi:phospholipid transport system substrate-binding protein